MQARLGLGHSRGLRVLLWAAPALLAIPLVGSVLPVQAASATCPSSTAGCVNVQIVPTSAAGEFNISLTNESSRQDLGSANITVPTGLTPLSVSGLNKGTATVSGDLIELRSLDIDPQQAREFSVFTTPPPPECSPVSYVWGIQAQESSDFQGDSDDYFAVDPNSQLTTTVSTGSCYLAFVAEPQDAQRLSGISSQAANPGGPPIEVAVESGGSTVPLTGVGISLAFTSGTGTANATLAGTVSAFTSSGLASFSYPSTSSSGLGYTLTATAAPSNWSIAPGTSTPFDVFDFLTTCTASATCTGTASNSSTAGTQGATTSSVSSSGGSGGLLEISVLTTQIYCSGYTAASATVLSDVTGTGGTATVTLEIGKALVDASPNNGASFYQVCIQFPTSSGIKFTGPSGPVAPGDAGLLPDCSSTTPAPCVSTRNKAKAGEVVITFITPNGDPLYRA